MLPIITGCASTQLTEAEKKLFAAHPPAGFILFRRNCESPAQIKALVKELKAISHDQCLIFIDQEGGRVARLTPPHFPVFPAMKIFGDLYQLQPEHAVRAAFLNGCLLGAMLHDLGITANCAPVADLALAGYHDIIGDRGFGADVQQCAELGRALAYGLLSAGILPVIKHIPGHGRAHADSHIELPEISEPLELLEQTDFAVFRQLADFPMAMAAHVRFLAVDNQPASTSHPVISGIIRDTMGFNGLLMADDINMKALEGTLVMRALATLEAGCDVTLHCSGEFAEMAQILPALPPITPEAAARWQKAVNYGKSFFLASAITPETREAMLIERDALLEKINTIKAA
ncbi:MAG: beta-N-acetylhexosaminidase [Alphaproteobacteria bacterium]